MNKEIVQTTSFLLSFSSLSSECDQSKTANSNMKLDGYLNIFLLKFMEAFILSLFFF